MRGCAVEEQMISASVWPAKADSCGNLSVFIAKLQLHSAKIRDEPKSSFVLFFNFFQLETGDFKIIYLLGTEQCF